MGSVMMAKSCLQTLVIQNKTGNSLKSYVSNMKKQFFFYGNSLVLAGVQATFKGYPGFDTIALVQPQLI
jgi:hypothetical protein